MAEGGSAGISPLDEAYGKRLDGDATGALRLATAILESGAEHLGAAALGARILVDEKRTTLAAEVAMRLVDATIRRGDLPAAVVAACIAADAGEKKEPLVARIAQAFARGSKRLADVPPAPPPLPAEPKTLGEIEKLDREALVARAEAALQKFLGEEDAVPDDAPLPALPLFSALGPKPLARLLSMLTVTETPRGGEAVKQGEEGRAAYIVVRGFLQVIRHGETGDTVLAALGPGAIFGEMALVSDAPRAASVVAVEPAQMLCIPRDELEALARTEPAIGVELGAFCHGRMLSNLLRTSDIMTRLELGERTSLIHRFVARTFAAGDVVLRKGEEAAGLLLIATGGVLVSSQDSEGDRIVLAELGPGDVVGEISLVLRKPASADVVAEHPTVALELKRDEFMDAIRRHPALLAELYELATKREEETRSVVAQEALDVDDIVLV